MSWLAELIPNYCCHCKRRLLEQEKILCLYCWNEVDNRMLSRLQVADTYLKMNLELPIEQLWCCAYFEQKSWLQAIVHQLKYYNHPEFSAQVIRHFRDSIRQELQHCDFDAIIGTPLHPRKRRERGYNQVDEMGRELSEILQVPYDTTWLVRRLYRKSQTRKNRFFRQISTANAFDIHPKQTANYRHILLIDDIITTGATLLACCKAIQQASNTRISILCLGQTAVSS